MVCIAINLVSLRMFDIAVRDLALAAGAFALAGLEGVRVGAGARRALAPRTATATT
jgi:hypothetical protein